MKKLVLLLLSFVFTHLLYSQAETGISFTGIDIKHNIPIYPGSKVIKESSSDGNYNLVLETTDQPEEVAFYYKKEMQKLGWPDGAVMSVKNSGKPYEGNFGIRVNLSDPYSEYTLDRTVSVPVSLNVTDNEWVTLLTDFVWPEPIDHSTLNAVVALDPETTEAFSELSPGYYILKCKQIMDIRHPDGIRHEHSVVGHAKSFSLTINL